MAEVNVRGPRPYRVCIGERLEAECAAHVSSLSPGRVVVLCQPTVAHYAHQLIKQWAEIPSTIIEIPDAEEAKTYATAQRLWDRLGELKIGRRDVIIGFGGGAATDLAGFIAATWMRGIEVIHIPTTVLAMVDAAVGGKTGINTPGGKNLVGAFHEPSAVFIDIQYLASVPQSDRIAGSAEIIKTGFIADPQILELYVQSPTRCLDITGDLPELIHRSVSVKANVVAQDLKESGLREILNYGHTFGHAVERYEQYRWRHGDAVAIGMAFVAHLSEIKGVMTGDLVALHEEILSSIGLPIRYQNAGFEDLYAAMSVDKKNRDGRIRFVALNDVATPTRIDDATTAQLKEAYARIS
ncbi:3-dehydroquinate synthase [Corynebacterium sp. ES2730-CONJ]|uniref:3-dehydroquinate synthase n=1 Tax=Corynebacterium sp. ES2730-CONJ TaxID=2973941 RepID=UPI00216AD15B|nr:3-dehydroquinate synthase [Corynebacterium sp. ES2730-CONJ]MCS4531050.1 3-dehydroquinate synthase [Corynebacterium sp. ES2730-CONJ]